MKVTELLKISCEALKLMSENGIYLDDYKYVNAWLEAIDMSSGERRDACKKILLDGSLSVCNIEYRLEVCCHSR